MIDDLIDDGDIVVCKRQTSANNGDTVVALITSGPSETGEATLKDMATGAQGRVPLAEVPTRLAATATRGDKKSRVADS